MEMPLDSRFPHYPGRALGFLYGRGSSTVVIWAGGATVEASPMASSAPEDLESFKRLIGRIRRDTKPANMAEAHDAILAAGWEYRGTLEYKVQSGLLLTDSSALAEIANEMWLERRAILAAAGGRHPEMNSEDWARWVAVTTRRNAAIRGARALALAAVEALVNELLAAQHPDEFADWETEKRMGFVQKLKKLLQLHGANPDDVPWLKALLAQAQLRNNLIHHRPEWIVDDSDDQSVEPNDDLTQESLAETLEAVHQAIRGLFALYGVPTPDTHRSEWLRRVAGW